MTKFKTPTASQFKALAALAEGVDVLAGCNAPKGLNLGSFKSLARTGLLVEIDDDRRCYRLTSLGEFVAEQPEVAAGRAHRTREEILEGAVIRRMSSGGEAVFVTCHNCGGSGQYPSSCIPAGQCRYYCWRNRDAETFGKLPVGVDKYVKGRQAADRALFRTRVQTEINRRERERTRPERDERRANVEPRLADAAKAVPDDEFIQSLTEQWVEKGELSERQWEALAEKVERERERAEKLAAARKPFDDFVTGNEKAPAGRLTGAEFAVLASKAKTYGHGWQARTVQKLMVQSRDGWRLWVTEPTIEIEDENGFIVRDEKRFSYQHPERGDVIRMNVTVEPSGDDPKFAFGKRPMKAEIIGALELPDNGKEHAA